jgi:hypothetical protein
MSNVNRRSSMLYNYNRSKPSLSTVNHSRRFVSSSKISLADNNDEKQDSVVGKIDVQKAKITMVFTCAVSIVGIVSIASFGKVFVMI